jgi:DNA-directed RNA polymerase subunit alpha
MRLKNILLAEGAYTLGDVLKMREIEWLKVPNMGRRSLNDLKECLAIHGLTLRT